MSEVDSEAPDGLSEKELVEILTAEIKRVQQVSSDRLVWLRVLEKAVNDVDSVVRVLKKDVAEISNQISARNTNQGIVSGLLDEGEPDDEEE